MSVCFVAPLHSSNTRGYSIERYAFEMQKGLARAGVRVISVTSGSRLEKTERTRVGRSIGIIYEGSKVLRRKGEFSLVHFADPVIALVAPVAKGIPIVTTVHEVPDSVSHGGMLGTGLRVLKLACSNSSALIADSTVAKDDLVRKLNIPNEKITVVSLGVDPRFAPMSRQRTSRKTLGYIGAYSPRKNVRLLLQAYGILCKEHPELNVQLELWGRTGKYTAEIESIVKTLRLPGVRLKGFAKEADLPQIYNSFDVFVFPSLKEGFGLPILEAKRCSVPTVLLKGVNIAEEVTRGSVISVDPHDMSDKIYSLLSDSEHADAVAREGLKYSMDFTWERTVEGVLKVYHSLGVGLNRKSVTEIGCALRS